MWVCSNHAFGVTHYQEKTPDGSPVVYTVTIPLDGFAACDCDAFAECKAKLKSRANELQVTCQHIALAFGEKCGWRSEHAYGRCMNCGRNMVRIEDVIPGWVGKDRIALRNDLIAMRKELDTDETTG